MLPIPIAHLRFSPVASCVLLGLLLSLVANASPAMAAIWLEPGAELQQAGLQLRLHSDSSPATLHIDEQGVHLHSEGELAIADLAVPGNLTVSAATLRLRDHAGQALRLRAHGHMLLQAELIDIAALANADSWVESGGDLLLSSAQPIRGDAHFRAGGSIRFTNPEGFPQALESPLDPILLALGDVSMFSYVGASLHVLAGGSINVDNEIRISEVEADPVHAIHRHNSALFNASEEFSSLASVELSDGLNIEIDGHLRPSIDLRAGINWREFDGGEPVPGWIGGGPPASFNTDPPEHADITVGSLLIDSQLGAGMILLTNRYRPHPELSGNIVVGAIAGNAVGEEAAGTEVYIDSSGLVETATIDTRSVADLLAARGGEVRILSEGPLLVGGINSAGETLSAAGHHQGAGNITLLSRQQSILAGALNAGFEIHDRAIWTGPAGHISVLAPNGNIELPTRRVFSGNVVSFNDPAVQAGPAGDIRVHAGQQLLGLELEFLAQAEALHGRVNGGGGRVEVSAGAGDINLLRLRGFGYAAEGTVLGSGGVSLIASDGAVRVLDAVGSIWTWTTAVNGTATGSAGDIEILAGGDIEIASQLSTRVMQAGSGSAGDAGDISVRSLGGSIQIGGLVDTWVSGLQGAGRAGNVDIEALQGDVQVGHQIIASVEVASDGGSGGHGGSITVAALANVALPVLSTSQVMGSYGSGLTLAGGGAIRIESALGDILFSPGALVATGYAWGDRPMNVGPAGDIELLALQGRVQLGGGLLAHNEIGFQSGPGFSVGAGGSIRVLARDGIDAPPGTMVQSQAVSGKTLLGAGGDIEILTEAGNLGFLRVWAHAFAAQGDVPGSGSIRLETGAGHIHVLGSEPLRSYALAPGGAVLATSGDIEVHSSGNIQLAGASRSLAHGAGPVQGSGAVRLLSSNGNIDSGDIYTDVRSAVSTGAAGEVFLEAPGGSISVGAVDSGSYAQASGASAGAGGNIRLLAGGPVSADALRSNGGLVNDSAHAGAGSIQIEASQGDIIFASLASDFLAGPGNLVGPAGDIRVVASQGAIITPSELISTANHSSVAGASVSRGGDIHMEAAQGIQWPASMHLVSTSDAVGGQATGPAGAIRVSAGAGNLQLRLAHAFVRSGSGSVHAGEGIDLRATQGELLVSETLSAFAQAPDGVLGDTGALRLEAAHSIQVSGPLSNYAWGFGAGASTAGSGPVDVMSSNGAIVLGRVENSLLADVATGNAGRIGLEAPAGNIYLANAVVSGTGVSGNAANAGRGGDVSMLALGDIVAQRIETSVLADYPLSMGTDAQHAGGGDVLLRSLAGNVELNGQILTGFMAEALPLNPAVPWQTGPAGDILVEALAGLLDLRANLFTANRNLLPPPNASLQGPGGAVTLRAATGDFGDGQRRIETQSVSGGGLNGGGGAVSVALGQGDIRLLHVRSNAIALSGNGWPAGAIDLVTDAGEIHIAAPTEALAALSRAEAGNAGPGAAIRVQASGSITSGTLINASTSSGADAAAGATGPISVRSDTGNISIIDIYSVSAALDGSSGPVAGLLLEAPQGEIGIGTIDMRSQCGNTGLAGSAGSAQVLARGTIQVGMVIAESIAFPSCLGASNAGDILLRSELGDVSSASLTADSRHNSQPDAAAGAIEVEGKEITISGIVGARGLPGTGSIRIVHGGDGLVPFWVGHLPNGVSGGLLTAEAALTPVREFLYSHHEAPNIWIVSVDPPAYPVGGSVSGLAGSGLVLRNNDSDELAITGNGPFEFATPLPDMSSYAVTVHTQPNVPNQLCGVTNGSGQVQGGPVTSVQIHCETVEYPISGSVQGLQGSGLVLRNNGGDDLNVSANGVFQFATPVPDLSSYAVSVHAQPATPNQLCEVIDGSGVVQGAPVTTIQIHCETEAYPISGLVQGLEGSGLVLRNNGADDLAIAANGPFQFATPIADGEAFLVSVLSEPGEPDQTCSVVGGSGTVNGGPVTTVVVDCVTSGIETSTTIVPLSGVPRAGQASTITVEVAAGSAPTAGSVTVLASSGESCSSSAPQTSTAGVGSWTCDLTFNSLGPGSLVASYAGSPGFQPSTSTASSVLVMRHADVAVSVDDGVPAVRPGSPAAYLFQVSNAGPDAAPGTAILAEALPPLLSPTWSCFDTAPATCPAAEGVGMPAFVMDLPPGGALEFLIEGEYDNPLPTLATLSGEAQVDADAPHFVFDPSTANNVAVDANDTDLIFRNGFE